LFDSFTKVLWITGVLGKAGTDSIMIDRLANGINTAGSIDVAWILANFVDAGFLKGTVAVTSTSGDTTVGLANFPKWTGSI